MVGAAEGDGRDRRWIVSEDVAAIVRAETILEVLHVADMIARAAQASPFWTAPEREAVQFVTNELRDHFKDAHLLKGECDE